MSEPEVIVPKQGVTEPFETRVIRSKEELLSLPDGTVIVWHDKGLYEGRKSGVLVNNTRHRRPEQWIASPAFMVEMDCEINEVTYPAWALVFDTDRYGKAR